MRQPEREPDQKTRVTLQSLSHLGLHAALGAYKDFLQTPGGSGKKTTYEKARGLGDLGNDFFDGL